MLKITVFYITKILGSALLVSLLCACGGGGGGGDTPASTAPALALFSGNLGGQGFIDGAGTAARFNVPFAVATDSAGNIYVADSGNRTIRKITPAGDVTTLAGSVRAFGSADGNGAAARFNSPTGIGDANACIFIEIVVGLYHQLALI